MCVGGVGGQYRKGGGKVAYIVTVPALGTCNAIWRPFCFSYLGGKMAVVPLNNYVLRRRGNTGLVSHFDGSFASFALWLLGVLKK
jgi:hypothetical protein